jgi:hypothetical protein
MQLSADGHEVIYRGVMEDNSIVEVRQPAADMDVMLILIANILKRQSNAEGSKMSPLSHEVEALEIEPGKGGSVVFKFRSPPGITRSFRVGSELITGASAMLARSRMQLLT